MSPSEFSRRILLSVTGMSPQVVTETLYSLVTAQNFIPTEIRIITTKNGRNRAVRDLLDPTSGKFHAFCRDHKLEGKIKFDESCIRVIHDNQGNPLPDIRTPQENSWAADEIANLVQELCSDEAAALHVSIAGGRKTMGFFLGYALSLFARQQDQLSHVLVSEPFENNPDFFYPSQKPKKIITSQGIELNASDAQVMLANIPLVRLRAGLPQDLLKGYGSYSTTVAAAQAGIDPVIELAFDLPNNTVVCSGLKIKMQPVHIAIILWFARLRIAGKKATLKDMLEVREFLEVYREIVSDWSGHFSNVEVKLKTPGNFKQFSQEKIAQIKNKLRNDLGPLASHYLIKSEGGRGNLTYMLTLPTDCIRL